MQGGGAEFTEEYCIACKGRCIICVVFNEVVAAKSDIVKV